MGFQQECLALREMGLIVTPCKVLHPASLLGQCRVPVSCFCLPGVLVQSK